LDGIHNCDADLPEKTIGNGQGGLAPSRPHAAHDAAIIDAHDFGADCNSTSP
jgi:hypothetical protein